MRLNPKCAPDALNLRLGDPRLVGHGATGPVRAVLGFCFQCFVDHFGDLFIRYRSRRPLAQLVMKTLDALIDVALPPFADRR